jgi:hypothetical protein
MTEDKDWVVQIRLNANGDAVSVRNCDDEEIMGLNSPEEIEGAGRIKKMSPISFVEVESEQKSVGSAAVPRRCYWLYIGGRYYLICI